MLTRALLFGSSASSNGGIEMEKELRCSFYRKSKNVDNGHGLGTCDLDGNQAICNGDLNFCDKPNRIGTSKNEQKGSGEERRKHPRVVLELPLEYRVTNIPMLMELLSLTEVKWAFSLNPLKTFRSERI